MRLCVGLVGALLGAARAGEIFVRQNSSSEPTTTSTTQLTTSSTTTSSTPSTSSTPTTTSTPTPTTSTPQPTTPGPTTGGGGGGTTEQDTTVFSTVTVTAGPRAASTVTRTTTVVETSYSVSTETRSDQQVETTTVYVTSTELVDAKMRRSAAAELAPRTTAGPAQVDAVPTAHPTVTPTVTSAEHGALELLQHILFRRATKTSVTTVTVSNSEQPSVVTTFSVVASTTTVVSVQTRQVNAKSTVTVTSTNVIRSTRLPSGTDIVSSPTESSSSSGGGGGLSTGAKAGIGVGAALGALAIIGLIAWLLVRRRRKPKPDHDDFMGASEVPVGGPAGGSPGARPGPMSETSSAGAGYLASGVGRAKPSTSPEGYRGTAMGDGRAGFAKPAPYGASYTPSGSTAISPQNRPSAGGGDQLPQHPTPADSSVSPGSPSTAELGSDSAAAAKWHNPDASEIDSHAVASQQSGPVYEMPSQAYR